MKSAHLCPICGQTLDWSAWSNGTYKLWCANPKCDDIRCSVAVDPKLGEDSNDAYDRLVAATNRKEQL